RPPTEARGLERQHLAVRGELALEVSERRAGARRDHELGGLAVRDARERTDVQQLALERAAAAARICSCNGCGSVMRALMSVRTPKSAATQDAGDGQPARAGGRAPRSDAMSAPPCPG